MEWIADVLAVAVGVWTAAVMLVVSVAALWGVWRRRRSSSGELLRAKLRLRGLFHD